MTDEELHELMTSVIRQISYSKSSVEICLEHGLMVTITGCIHDVEFDRWKDRDAPAS